MIFIKQEGAGGDALQLLPSAFKKTPNPKSMAVGASKEEVGGKLQVYSPENQSAYVSDV